MDRPPVPLLLAAVVLAVGVLGAVGGPGGAAVGGDAATPTDNGSDDAVPAAAADRLAADTSDAPAAWRPAGVDTDGDGFVDALERQADELPEADPFHKDVYVEVDYMEGCSLDSVNRTVEAFADAPVRNPDGERGIALHPVVDDEVPRRDAVTLNHVDRYRNGYFDRRLQGYHYVVLVGDVSGQTGYHTVRTSIAECRGDVFMHELGHSLGLSEGVAGVDSRAVRFTDYPSVMNYNAPTGHFDYSTGGHSEDDHDDWSFVARNLDTRAPSTYELRKRYLDDPVASGDGGDGSDVWDVTATPATNATAGG